MAKYIGKRIVSVHCGRWDQTKTYEMLSIVLEETSGDSYISRRAVPSGTAITDTNYWMLHSLYSQQIKDMSDQLSEAEARIKADNDATESAIRQDNDATEAAIKADNKTTRDHVDENLAQTTETLTETVNSARTAMTQQKASFDQTSAALNTRMDAVLAAGTGAGDTEILDARVDGKGYNYDSLGSHIRSIHPAVSEEISDRLNAMPFMVNVHDGYYVAHASGRLVRSGYACYTDRVPCKEGDVFHVLSNGYMEACAALLFHNNEIVMHYGDDNNTYGGAASEYDITIPEGVNWIQFSCVNKDRGFTVSKDEANKSIGVLADIHEELDSLQFHVVESKRVIDDIVDRSVNMFNKDDPRNMTNEYLDGNGVVQQLDRAGMSHPILVYKDVSYKWSAAWGFWGGNAIHLVRTDSEGNVKGSARATLSEDHSYVTYTPQENGYLRVKFFAPSVDNMIFTREDEWPEEFVPYYVKMRYADLTDYATSEDLAAAVDNLATKEDVAEFQPNLLYGKTAVFDGDSIGQGSSVDGNWAKVIGPMNHMDWHNCSIGGGTITAELYYSSGSPRHWVSRYIETIHNNYPEIDYLIFEGGTNDADLLGSAGLGELDLTDFSGNYDDTNFTGALESLFFKATSYYPTAKIGYIVAQKMGAGLANQNSRRNFFLRAIEVCKKWGIPYIDLWEGSPLNPRLKCFYDSSLDAQGNRDAGKAYIDGQHLTATGYAIVSSKIEAWMRTL